MRDRARIRTLRERLGNRAHQRAMHELRDRHRGEFEHLLELHRAEVGLYPDRIDLEVAEAAWRDRRPRRPSNGFRYTDHDDREVSA